MIKGVEGEPGVSDVVEEKGKIISREDSGLYITEVKKNKTKHLQVSKKGRLKIM